LSDILNQVRVGHLHQNIYIETYTERCLRGRKDQFAKLTYWKRYRGFESLLLRSQEARDLRASFFYISFSQVKFFRKLAIIFYLSWFADILSLTNKYMEDKKSPLDQFQEILEQQHKNATRSVNDNLLNVILKTAKIVEENKDETKLKEIISDLRERFKNENLNQVTEIFKYCQSFLSTNEDPLPTPSQLCISIGKLFTNENLHYTASKVYSKDEIEGGCALSFLGYLAMHEHHTDYILSFINGNFEGFSKNKKTECVFQLKEALPDNEIAKQ
jgi:hypothetical protein